MIVNLVNVNNCGEEPITKSDTFTYLNFREFKQAQLRERFKNKAFLFI